MAKGQDESRRDSFESRFKTLTGNPPFPWQRALYARFISEGRDHIPSSCNLPTGLGKTSVIAIWLLALAETPARIPRRLVYVVNRRTVVDQSTREAEHVRKRIKDVPAFDAALRAMCARPKEGEPPLAISTLRGQFADNREWSADPARPAIIVGTVDMIGSRLLFSGYGVGFKGKPLHAGFLGQDVLLVHDEAHLEPAFQTLLETIQCEQHGGHFDDQGRCVDQGRRGMDFKPMRVMALTATPRGGEHPFGLTEDEENSPDVVPDRNEPLYVAWRRLRAKKALALVPVADEKQVVPKIVEMASKRGEEAPDCRVIIFVRMLEAVGEVRKGLRAKGIPDTHISSLTGTMRSLERNRQADPRQEKADPVFARFLKPSGPDEEPWKVSPRMGTVFLICTAAGEVGVDISADHLVCDLTPFDSMAQRLGRVNRYGTGDAQVDVVHETKASEKRKDDPFDRRRWIALERLKDLHGDASPHAIGRLPLPERVAAFTPTPEILPATDILFDAWALTTIREKLPGRPPVEPYLHGIRDYEPPETHVAWREEVGVIVGDLLAEYPPREVLEAYPVKPLELLRDRTDRVWKEIAKLATRHPHKPVWIVDDEGNVAIVPHLSELAARQNKDAEARIAKQTVLLPHDIGGLTDQGMLNGDVPPPPKQNEAPIPTNHDVADEWTGASGRMRVRSWTTPEELAPVPPAGMKLAYQVVVMDPADQEGEPIKTWHWFVRVLAADPDARSRTSYDLAPHLDDAKEAASRFVSRLSLDPGLPDAVILAARFHDLGKHRERWQRGIGNTDYPEIVWAKSGRRRGKIERHPYRHEFGSLLDVQERPEFKALPDELKDLVLHLMAAHHGRGRPHFPEGEALDDVHPGDATREQSIEVARRFARLQRKFGRWGLAYLESLVRAADYAASAKADYAANGGAR